MRGRYEGDAADLEQFAAEPHSERTNAFMRVELASLLEGWTRVRDEGKSPIWLMRTSLTRLL